jgi:hypothetical protein
VHWDNVMMCWIAVKKKRKEKLRRLVPTVSLLRLRFTFLWLLFKIHNADYKILKILNY